MKLNHVSTMALRKSEILLNFLVFNSVILQDGTFINDLFDRGLD